MKMTTLKSVAIAVGVTSSAFGQATSPVVGYETLAIDQPFATIGLRLLGKTDVSTTVSAVSGTSITLADAPSSDGRLLVEVVDGAAAGTVVPGTVTGTTIVTDEDMSTGGNAIAVGDSVTFRELQSLESVFGNPSVLDGASAEASADLVSIPDGTGGFDTYFFFNGGFVPANAGWRLSGQTTGVIDASAVEIVYTDGMIITNRGANNELVVSGALKTTPTSYALTTQFNYVSSVYPVGSTLENSGLENTLTAASAEASADLVSIPNATGFDTYFFFNGGFVPANAGWRLSGQTTGTIDASLVDLSSGMIITNRGPAQNTLTSPPAFYAGL